MAYVIQMVRKIKLSVPQLKAVADGPVGQVLAGSVSELNKKLITMTMLT